MSAQAVRPAILKKRPTRARVERVRRIVDQALDELSTIDSRRSVSISASLCRSRAALTHWLEDLGS